jgi:hypothetical protein
MIKNFFWHFFSDKSPLNGTVVIGFLAFSIMALFAIADVATGLFGKDLVINDVVYNAFTIIVGGAFLGAGASSVMGNKNLKDGKE